MSFTKIPLEITEGWIAPEVNHVALNVLDNEMSFQNISDGQTLSCGTWGLYGNLYDLNIDEQDRNHWLPHRNIPTIIAYVNYKFYAAWVDKTNETGIENLNRILQKQIDVAGDISNDMRRSIDEQIAAMQSEDTIKMMAKQDAEDSDPRSPYERLTKEEWLGLHGRPFYERLVLNV